MKTTQLRTLVLVASFGILSAWVLAGVPIAPASSQRDAATVVEPVAPSPVEARDAEPSAPAHPSAPRASSPAVASPADALAPAAPASTATTTELAADSALAEIEASWTEAPQDTFTSAQTSEVLQNVLPTNEAGVTALADTECRGDWCRLVFEASALGADTVARLSTLSRGDLKAHAQGEDDSGRIALFIPTPAKFLEAQPADEAP